MKTHNNPKNQRLHRFASRFAFFCLLLTTYCSIAQTVKRVELPLPGTNESFHTISLGAKGVVLVSQLSKNAFNIQKLNADLERDWSINGTIEENLDFVKSSVPMVDYWFLKIT